MSNSFAEMKRCKRNTHFHSFWDVSLYNFHISCRRGKENYRHIEGHEMNQTWDLGSKEVMGCRSNS